MLGCAQELFERASVIAATADALAASIDHDFEKAAVSPAVRVHNPERWFSCNQPQPLSCSHVVLQAAREVYIANLGPKPKVSDLK